MISDKHPSRALPEENNEDFVFMGTLKDQSLSTACAKLQSMAGNKLSSSYVYVLVTKHHISLLLESTKSRQLNITVSKGSFSDFHFKQQHANYKTEHGMGFVCCVSCMDLHLFFRKEQVKPTLAITSQAILLRHSYADQIKTQVLVTMMIRDKSVVPLLKTHHEEPLIECIPEGSLDPVRSLDFVGTLSIVKIGSKRDKELEFARSDESAFCTTRLSRQRGELQELHSYLWNDILFMICLARTNEKVDLTLKFYPNRLQTEVRICEADYLLEIARSNRQ